MLETVVGIKWTTEFGVFCYSEKIIAQNLKLKEKSISKNIQRLNILSDDLVKKWAAEQKKILDPISKRLKSGKDNQFDFNQTTTLEEVKQIKSTTKYNHSITQNFKNAKIS
jgi:vacuolar-type H+-ATPase subunit H